MLPSGSDYSGRSLHRQINTHPPRQKVDCQATPQSADYVCLSKSIWCAISELQIKINRPEYCMIRRNSTRLFLELKSGESRGRRATFHPSYPSLIWTGAIWDLTLRIIGLPVSNIFILARARRLLPLMEMIFRACFFHIFTDIRLFEFPDLELWMESQRGNNSPQQVYTSTEWCC
jgi:hypothetical protein